MGISPEALVYLLKHCNNYIDFVIFCEDLRQGHDHLMEAIHINDK
jgi:hypothetical protein